MKSKTVRSKADFSPVQQDDDIESAKEQESGRPAYAASIVFGVVSLIALGLAIPAFVLALSESSTSSVATDGLTHAEHKTYALQLATVEKYYAPILERIEELGHVLTNATNQELFQQMIRQIATSASGIGPVLRFTVMNSEGKVLADSARGSVAAVNSMDNHSNRHEQIRAAANGLGVTTRLSSTTNEHQRYASKRVETSTVHYIVRVASSLS
jgi:hypothetical protein